MARSRIFLLTALLLTFWSTRIIGVNAFPPFVDEAFHVNFGTNILESGPFAHSDEGRQLTLWWYMAMQAQAAAQIPVARIATLLAVLPGVAAALGGAQLLAGTRSATMAALLFTFSPFHLFFDRLALADPVSASAILVAVYFAARLSCRVNWSDAVLCGLALFVAVGAKVSALPYLGIPIAAALTLKPAGRPWKAQAVWAFAAAGVGVSLSGGFLLLIYLRGYDPFFYLQGTPTTISLQTYVGKLTAAWLTVTGYAGIITAMALITSLTVLLLRRKWFLPLCLLVPLLVLSASSRQDSRHLIAPFSLLLLGGAVAVESINARYHSTIQNIALALVLLWGLVVWLPFARTTLTHPVDLQLTQNDRDEYMLAEASGFGLGETLTALQPYRPERIIGILANCLSLRYMAGSSLIVDCPHMNPNGADRDALATLLNDSRQTGVYAVLEAIPYAPASAPGEPIAVIDSPPGRPTLTIYDLSPRP